MDVATSCGGADSLLTAVAYSWRIPYLTGYRVAAGGREMSVAVSGAAASSMKTATTCRRTACSRSAPARIMPAIAHGGHGGDGLSSSSAARDLAEERAGVGDRDEGEALLRQFSIGRPREHETGRTPQVHRSVDRRSTLSQDCMT